MFKFEDSVLQYFLVHPGGPFWKNKDIGSWTIPKGEVHDQEDLKQTAIREFQEETGIIADMTNIFQLGDVIQKSGKKVYAWAFEHNFTGQLKSNLVEHPTLGNFPEVDKGEYFDEKTAKMKINLAQASFLDRLKLAIS